MQRNSFYNPETGIYLDPTKDRRVALITGGNRGVGFYTVLHLYLHGFIVYLAGRSSENATKAFEEIQREAEKRISKYTESEKKQRFLGELHHVYIDLLDLNTIEETVTAFASKESMLHVLICNAGIMAQPFKLTKDGYDIQYQVNYVSQLLLTLKLLPYINNVTKEGKTQPRIVLLSSVAHKFVFKKYHPSARLNNTPDLCWTWVRYGVSKLAQIQFAKYFTKLHPEILTIPVHPGLVFNTDLYNRWKEIPFLGFFVKGGIKVLDCTNGVTNEEGALSSLKAVLDDSLTAEKNGGDYFVTGGIKESPTKIALDEEFQRLVYEWNISELTKKKFLLDDSSSDKY